MIVFMYHNIADEEDLYSIGLDMFSTHLELFSEYKENIILSFDDGFSQIEEAVEKAVSLGFRVVVFVVAGRISDILDGRRILSKEQIKKLHNLGVEIGSHGLSHNPLFSLEVLGKEAKASKMILEDIVGSNIEWFSFPKGIMIKGSKNLLLELGYRFIATSEPGFWNGKSVFIPRFVVRKTDSLLEIKMIASGNLWFGIKRFAERKLLLAAKRLMGKRLYDTLKCKAVFKEKR